MSCLNGFYHQTVIFNGFYSSNAYSAGWAAAPEYTPDFSAASPLWLPITPFQNDQSGGTNTTTFTAPVDADAFRIRNHPL